MSRTTEYWRPTNGLYHATPPGIAVLTQDSDWETLNEATGFYGESPYPSAFKGQVYRALNYTNATSAGASLLWNLYTTNNSVNTTPSLLGNNVQSINQPMTLDQVAREIIVGTGSGPQTQTVLNQTGTAPWAQIQWLTYIINSSSHWALDGVPGNGGGLYDYLERVCQYTNRWMLLFDHRYFCRSDSNEGYFNEQSYNGHFGIPVHNIIITNHEVAAWLVGQPPPHHLSDAQQNHAQLATIVALKDVSPSSAGCSVHVRWNPTATNPLNWVRPPAIGLAHKLLHTCYSCRGARPSYDDNHHSTVLFEYRCVGLGPWDEASLSENALRKEWQSYACQQVSGSDPENRKAIGKRINYMQSSPLSRQKRGTQTPRFTDSSTSLPLTASAPAALFPERLAEEERLNALPDWELLSYSANPLALDGTIATHLTAILHNDADQRPLDDLVVEIHQLPGDVSAERYQVLLRPWLWWLTLASNNRVFQNLATSDIVTQVFDQHGFDDYQLQLSGSYQPREYCVQYGESDFAFVLWLLGEDGIFQFLTHVAGKHTLVLADSNDALPPTPNGPQVAYLGQGIGVCELQGMRSAQYSLQVVSRTYSTIDYEFTIPGTSLYFQAEAVSGVVGVYQHPDGYTAKVQGDSLAKQRINDLRSQETCLIGEDDCRWLVPGHWFTLNEYDGDSLNIDWILTPVTHDASYAYYRNRFEAVPKATAYRLARVTPKPRMHAQTTLVVSKAGEEIWTGQYGRIRTQSLWDRDGKNDETSSRWVRVVLPWSGKGFGMQLAPRIGQEAIVAFIDGDPDRLLVTGCVYSGDNAPPYALPDNQTQSGIKTNSSKGGGGFNELRFEDKRDAEEVFPQTQKDLNVNVLNDSTVSIGHGEVLTVQNVRIRMVKEGDETVTLGKDKRTVTIQAGSDSLDVKDTRTVTVGVDQTHSIGGNYSHKVSGNFELMMGGNLTIKVSDTLALQNGGSLTLKSNTDFAAQAGTSLTSKVETLLTNRVGTSLTNEAGTSLTNDAGVSLTNKAGAEQTVDGGGMLTIRDGLVKAS